MGYVIFNIPNENKNKIKEVLKVDLKTDEHEKQNTGKGNPD